MIAARAFTAAKRTTPKVVRFPLFEEYGDQIVEWISAIDRGSGRSLVKSMRQAAIQLEKVRSCERYVNLATFVRHAASALEASERDGARYLLMTSLALTAPLPSERRAERAIVYQFVPAMGMAAG